MEGVLLILVILFHRDSIRSRDKEAVALQHQIDRLAKENHKHRDRYENMQDRIENLTKQLRNQSPNLETKTGHQP